MYVSFFLNMVAMVGLYHFASTRNLPLSALFVVVFIYLVWRSPEAQLIAWAQRRNACPSFFRVAERELQLRYFLGMLAVLMAALGLLFAVAFLL
jgi:hypothetical protein